MRRRILSANLGLLLLCTMLWSQSPQKRPMTVDDILNMIGVSNAEISPDGKWIVFSRSSLNWEENKRPTHLWIVSTEDGEPFQFTSQEGDSSPQWSPDSTTVAFLRGAADSAGQGGAEPAGRQVWTIRIGGGDYWDAMTGVDAVIERGIADPSKLAVKGWSYGGMLGGWTLTQTKRFKAASLGAMVTDWSSEYAMGFNFDTALWYIGGTPWDNTRGYRKQSSYSFIKNVSTPRILFHGEQDTTCSIGQSMMFYQGSKDRRVPVRFLRFPREPHGFREPHHQRIRDV